MSKTTGKDWKTFKEEAILNEDKIMDDDVEQSSSDDSTSSLEHLSYAELEEKLTIAEQKAHENWEKSVRSSAELANALRRADRDVDNARKFGKEKFVQALLPVIDSLDQAIQLTNNEADARMKEGLDLTMKLFLDVLQKFDVVQLNPLGEVFNPTEQEAISVIQTNESAPNTVTAVFQKGYKLHDRIIRPAMVVVAKA